MHCFLKFLLVMILAIPAITFAAPPSSNETLAKLKMEDQADRKPASGKIDWTTVQPRDITRRSQALQIINDAGLQTATDYFNAALIFQHGETPEDIQLAYSLATVAARIDPANKSAKWLSAAAWDRILMYRKKPQWYGTQFHRGDNGKMELYTVDESAVTDEERVALNVPTLAQAKEIAVRHE